MLAVAGLESVSLQLLWRLSPGYNMIAPRIVFECVGKEQFSLCPSKFLGETLVIKKQVNQMKTKTRLLTYILLYT